MAGRQFIDAVETLIAGGCLALNTGLLVGDCDFGARDDPAPRILDGTLDTGLELRVRRSSEKYRAGQQKERPQGKFGKAHDLLLHPKKFAKGPTPSAKSVNHLIGRGV